MTRAKLLVGLTWHKLLWWQNKYMWRWHCRNLWQSRDDFWLFTTISVESTQKGYVHCAYKWKRILLRSTPKTTKSALIVCMNGLLWETNRRHRLVKVFPLFLLQFKNNISVHDEMEMFAAECSELYISVREHFVLTKHHFWIEKNIGNTVGNDVNVIYINEG